ncbi:hypothetical protein DCCM_4168 [Desulfocucumis palustris]|uniref:SLH domain-containing protein n=1 Tax=Desulfocucumis palustris TaxID=1898651 RepID=A0A2L2XFC6_9FIRM|nr:S-layer homology domain-containing protein [Desulfocucumis palustris]GBF35047.1 hypothetical protein DCCM_4168 [Desulfocucumis palustris]
MRVKKLLLIITAACLSVALTAGSAMAAPAWKDNNKMKGREKSNAAKKVQFKDISGHWAEQNIVLINAENVIKGYTDNTFQPNKPVDKEEAITMIVRMASGDISDNQLPPGKYNNINRASSWARSYLNMAVEKGILSQVELNTLAFDKPAQRYEVAVWLVRAMGLEDEAIENTGEDLEFRDEAAIPAWATGYVKVASDEGIISGYPGHLFKPGDPVTRAEIATMLVRAREGSDIPSPRQGFSYVHGIISEIDDGDDSSIILKRISGKSTASGELTVFLDNDPLIYLDGKSAEVEDLDEGDTVAVLMDSDRNAIVVIARSTGDSIDEDEDEDEDDNDNGTVDGIVESVGSSSITIKVDGDLKVYDLDKDVEVEIYGEEADLEDIEKGYEVELTLDDGEVTKIEAETQNGYVTGVLESVGKTRIKVEVNNVLKTYALDEDVDVKLDGDDADIDDLEEGYQVKLTMAGGKVIKIVAKSETVSAVLESVGSSSITVKEDGVYKVYNLAGGVDVIINDDDGDLEDLKKGADVKLTIENGKVVKIVAWVVSINIS